MDPPDLTPRTLIRGITREATPQILPVASTTDESSQIPLVRAPAVAGEAPTPRTLIRGITAGPDIQIAPVNVPVISGPTETPRTLIRAFTNARKLTTPLTLQRLQT